jgi:hydrogenase expression/formation protein HypC
MCLGIPARVVAITDPARGLALAEVGGSSREVNLGCLVEPGEDTASLVDTWVMLFAGFAIARMTAEDAHTTLELLAAAGMAGAELAGLAAP